MDLARAFEDRWARRLTQVLRVRTAILAGALLAMMLLTTACGGSKSGATVKASNATPSPAAGASETAGPAPAEETPKPTETAYPGQVVTSVKELVEKFGWPPGTDFARIRIPSIGVDAKVGSRVVGSDAVMAAPAGPADIVWYDMSAWNGMGGTPGKGHNAVFSGHVDYAYNIPYAKVNYRGQGVFSQVRLLSQGDVIDVDYGGQTLHYKVVWRKQLNASEATDWGSIWSGNVPKDSITLYTCGGAFDAKTLEYSDRVVVRAERV